MKKQMIKAYQPRNGMHTYLVISSEKTSEFCEYLKAAGAEIKIFEVSNIPLAELPEDVKEEVKDTLKVFNNANVVFEYNKFYVTASVSIKSYYNYDHFVCGRYNAREVYTEDERRQHLAELNAY